MKLVDQIMERLGYSPKSAAPRAMSLQEFSDYVTGLGMAGSALNEKSALTISAIYASAGLIAGAIASLPLHIFETTDDGGRDRVRDDPLWEVFNLEMAPGWSASVAWEYLTLSLLLHGNFYAPITRRGGGLTAPAITALEPWHPQLVNVVREPTTRRLVYLVYPDPTERGAPVRVFDQDDMIHVPGFGFDGLRGYSPLRLALREAGAVALAAQSYSRAFFENGARADFVLASDNNITQEQVDLIRAQWDEIHRGPKKAHRPAILGGGLKPETISLPAEDAQLVAQRQFQIEEIARIFGVPPFMIGHTEKTTSWGSGVEAMGIGFVKYTLQRHLSKIQTELRRKCFRGTGRFCEFATAALERGDLKSQSESFRIALGRAGEANWMTVNEVRRLLNLPAVEGGDAMRIASDKPALSVEDLQ